MSALRLRVEVTAPRRAGEKPSHVLIIRGADGRETRHVVTRGDAGILLRLVVDVLTHPTFRIQGIDHDKT